MSDYQCSLRNGTPPTYRCRSSSTRTAHAVAELSHSLCIPNLVPRLLSAALFFSHSVKKQKKIDTCAFHTSSYKHGCLLFVIRKIRATFDNSLGGGYMYLGTNEATAYHACIRNEQNNNDENTSINERLTA